jgi:hypothetical protein
VISCEKEKPTCVNITIFSYRQFPIFTTLAVVHDCFLSGRPFIFLFFLLFFPASFYWIRIQFSLNFDRITKKRSNFEQFENFEFGALRSNFVYTRECVGKKNFSSVVVDYVFAPPPSSEIKSQYREVTVST